MTLKPSSSGIIHFRDTFFLSTNNPIFKIDTSKISIFTKDTINVSFESIIDEKENKLSIIFDKKPIELYNISFLPEAISDVYDFKNDSLKYRIRTNEIEDYGRITLKIENANSKNFIIELLDPKLKLVQRNFITNSTTIIYDLLNPKIYTIRAIEDTNKNNKWDTGNYLNKILPEKIIYYNDEDLSLRPNYYLNPIFKLN